MVYAVYKIVNDTPGHLYCGSSRCGLDSPPGKLFKIILLLISLAFLIQLAKQMAGFRGENPVNLIFRMMICYLIAGFLGQGGAVWIWDMFGSINSLVAEAVSAIPRTILEETDQSARNGCLANANGWASAAGHIQILFSRSIQMMSSMITVADTIMPNTQLSFEGSRWEKIKSIYNLVVDFFSLENVLVLFKVMAFFAIAGFGIIIVLKMIIQVVESVLIGGISLAFSPIIALSGFFSDTRKIMVPMALKSLLYLPILLMVVSITITIASLTINSSVKYFAYYTEVPAEVQKELRDSKNITVTTRIYLENYAKHNSIDLATGRARTTTNLVGLKGNVSWIIPVFLLLVLLIITQAVIGYSKEITTQIAGTAGEISPQAGKAMAKTGQTAVGMAGSTAKMLPGMKK